jgi:hypothetical protein
MIVVPTVVIAVFDPVRTGREEFFLDGQMAERIWRGITGLCPKGGTRIDVDLG